MEEAFRWPAKLCGVLLEHIGKARLKVSARRLHQKYVGGPPVNVRLLLSAALLRRHPVVFTCAPQIWEILGHGLGQIRRWHARHGNICIVMCLLGSAGVFDGKVFFRIGIEGQGSGL